jgi:hypothetical protein
VPNHVTDMTGEVISYLVVLGRAVAKPGAREVHWQCRCHCGKQVIVPGTELRRGRHKTKSCGCHLHNDEAAIASLERRYISSARHRNLPYTLTYDQFKALATAPCHWCGVAPQFRDSKYELKLRIRWATNGVDRKDSSVGYVDGNVVPCCSLCNQMKFDYSAPEFLEHVRKITEWQEFGAVQDL